VLWRGRGGSEKGELVSAPRELYRRREPGATVKQR
jgi:hypothetical protein